MKNYKKLYFITAVLILLSFSFFIIDIKTANAFNFEEAFLIIGMIQKQITQIQQQITGLQEFQSSTSSPAPAAPTESPSPSPRPEEELTVSVSASPPLTSINQPVKFHGNAEGGTGEYSYKWTGACQGTGNNCEVVNGFRKEGIYTARLTVKSGGKTAYATDKVYISAGTLMAKVWLSAGSDSKYIPVGQKVTFTGNAIGGTGNYSVKWIGIKCENEDTSTYCEATAPQKVGPYTITFEVTDGVQRASDSINVFVFKPLTVAIEVSSNPAVQYQKVTFLARTEGGSGPYSYRWEIDGKYQGKKPFFIKKFTHPRSYSISLTVISENEKVSAIIALEVKPRSYPSLSLIDRIKKQIASISEILINLKGKIE